MTKSQTSITTANGISTAVSPNPVKAKSQVLIVINPIPLGCNRRAGASLL
jgi:hypothetical protein